MPARLADGCWRTRSTAAIIVCAHAGSRRQPYVLAVRSNHHLRFIAQEGLIETDPKTIAEDLPTDAWTTLAAGEGAKGLRLYALAAIACPGPRTRGSSAGS